MKHVFLWLMVFALQASLIGCSGREADDSPGINAPAHAVTLVTSTGGIGDNGYNDLVLTGAMRFYRDHDDIGFSLHKPRDFDDARTIVDQWKRETAGQSSEALLILASDSYHALMEESVPSLAPNQRILLFECDGDGMPQGVCTFRICRYGASYLSGAAAAESPDAHIIAANNSDELLRDAVNGFIDGYRDVSGNTAIVHYLANDDGGYSMPNKAYELAQNFDEVFIFPLAGGSNSGIYKFSREDKFTLQLIAGMDADCSDYSTRVPFSLLVHIDRVIYDMLDRWIKEGTLPQHTNYTLADRDAIEVTANPLFLKRVSIFLDYYSTDDYWQKQLDNNYEAACRKEEIYYE